MRVYHERLRTPFSWWLFGLATMLLLATEVVAGWAWPIAVAIYVVLVGLVVALLWSWGRPTVAVSDGELRAGPAVLPLDAVGEVTALDEAQTRSLRGPRGDPAAFLMIRPYLRQGVYVEVTRPGAETRQGRRRLRMRGFRPHVEVSRLVADSPYWLICTRHPAELAAAINGARAATPAGGATMG
jgi:Protein of unknown function (DUF3093)